MGCVTEAVQMFDVHAGSDRQGIAADWLEDQGRPFEAAVMRGGLWTPSPSPVDGHGYGYGYGNGDGDGDG